MVTSSEEVEIAWFAGLFEGEGCIHVRRKGVGRDRWNAVMLTVGSTDRDVIEHAQRVMGCTIEPQSIKGGLGKKPLYRWRVSNKPDVARVLRLIGPHLSERRMRKVADAYEVLALINPARAGWTVSGRNEPRQRRVDSHLEHLPERV